MYIQEEMLALAATYLNRIKRSGPENIMAACPFHRRTDGREELNPSFAFSLTSGLWFCHSCKAKGNLRSFLKNFGIQRDDLGGHYANLLERVDRSSTNSRPAYLVIDLEEEPLSESILGLFEGCPLALLDEGFQEDVLRFFDVGFDERNMRITFPLRDFLGRLVGISGRAVGEGTPRYKIYDFSEYEVWGLPPRKTKKYGILWNIDKVYPVAFFDKTPEVVIVEGFKACMWVHQAGIPNVVALLGSHLTREQRIMLERIGGTFYIFTDNDEAGSNARKEVAKILAKTCDVKVVIYDEKQPTDLTEETVREVLLSAVPYTTYLLEQ